MVTVEFGGLGGYNDGVMLRRSVALTLVKSPVLVVTSSKSLMVVLEVV